MGRCRFECLLTCIFAFATLVSAQQPQAEHHSSIWEPPTIVGFPDSVKATIPKPMIAKLRVAELPVILEETELAAVQARLGGTIGSRGDAGDALQWLCFHGVSSGRNWVLWLMSSEIDGGTVGGLRWQSVSEPVSFDVRCQTLRGSVAFPVDIKPGVSGSDVVRAFGQPSSKSANALFYLHEHDENIHNQPYTAMNTLEVLLRDGVVWTIELWKSTTS